MHKTLITLALLPLLGAGCFGSPTPDGEGPYTNEPTPAPGEVMTPEAPTTEEAAPQPVVQTPTDSLQAETQTVGSEVVIKNVNLSKPGYIAIHGVLDGKPGNIIGFSGLLNAGETKEVYVELDTVVDHEYFAVLHTDDGDKKFIIGKDAPTTYADGSTVMMKFKVTK